MEALTRMVADSLARHGLDRPVDPRRLQWSRWSRCDSPHSLLVVPSKPGIFALAEEITASVARAPSPATAAADAQRGSSQTGRSVNSGSANDNSGSHGSAPLGGAALQHCDSDSIPRGDAALAAELPTRRLLAVLQFCEDDDMAFTLDRMFTRINPMRDRLASGRCFLRFVVIEDQAQRRTICSALNQWMLSSAEKATGLPPDFSSSLEVTRVGAGDSPAHESTTTRVGRTLLSDSADTMPTPAPTSQPVGNKTNVVAMLRNPDSGAAKNLHCPHPLPSGF